MLIYLNHFLFFSRLVAKISILLKERVCTLKFDSRKYYKGHLIESFWLWGTVERSSGRVITCLVKYSDKVTLNS